MERPIHPLLQHMSLHTKLLWTWMKPFPHDPPQNLDFLRQINFTSRDCLHLIWGFRAFASFHTISGNELTNIPSDENINIYKISQFSRIFFFFMNVVHTCIIWKITVRSHKAHFVIFHKHWEYFARIVLVCVRLVKRGLILDCLTLWCDKHLSIGPAGPSPESFTLVTGCRRIWDYRGF